MCRDALCFYSNLQLIAKNKQTNKQTMIKKSVSFPVAKQDENTLN